LLWEEGIVNPLVTDLLNVAALGTVWGEEKQGQSDFSRPAWPRK